MEHALIMVPFTFILVLRGYSIQDRLDLVKDENTNLKFSIKSKQ